MKISVLTPSFNSAQYLKRAIESVLQQDYRHWEHIIMDGGSSDGTLDVLKSYPHLIWVSENDKGQSDAMNRAFARATGDVIIYLNADDELADGAFSFYLNRFNSHPGADMIVGDLKINNAGKIVFQNPSVSLQSVLNYWPCKFPMNPVCYAYKASLQEKIGPFPIDNHYTMDYWFILRAYLFGTVIKGDFICGTFHLDGTNKSSDAERSRNQLKLVRDAFLRRYWYRVGVAVFIVKKFVSAITR